MKFPRVVYAIRHVPTGKVYVGSTANITLRVAQHLTSLWRGDHPVDAMQIDFDDRGDGYEVYLLDSISGMGERYKEYLWMDALNTRDPECGYNVKDRGRLADLSKKKPIPLPHKKRDVDWRPSWKELEKKTAILHYAVSAGLEREPI